MCGPSGVGKGTLVAAVRARLPGVDLSVSATTRAPRPGEQDGREYFFVTDAQFDELVATDALLEWAQYAGTRYGTPRQPVLDAVARGRDVILEIEVQGARQVRQRLPQATFVFIAPPSLDELRARLVGRGTESPERVATRLAVAESELACVGEFDVVIVNDEVDRAVDQLVELISRSRAAGSTSAPVEGTHEGEA
ncbi:MAG: guanylate kinase [Propionibacteriaceae bacterium]|nr:guanylate kinase [Propionibacteriaceae bacterium]